MLRAILLFLLISPGVLAQQRSAAGKATTGDFQISGTVVDYLTGEALSNTRVAVAPVSQRDNFTTIVTHEDGRFLFQRLAQGKYTLTAQRRGYVSESFNQHEQYASSIAVGPELDTGHLMFRLPGESLISGTVTDDHGDGVRDAQVMLFQQTLAGGSRSTRRRATATSDEDGFYHFAHLPAGRYFVAVSAHPWYAQHFTPRNTHSVSVVQGNSVSTTTYGNSGSVMGNTGQQEPEEESHSPLDVSFPLTFYPGVTDAAGASAIVVGKGEKVSADVVLAAVPAVHFRVDTRSSGQQTAAPVQPQGLSIVLQQELFDGAAIPVYTQYMPVEPGVMEVVGVTPGRYDIKINSWSGGKTEAMQEREVEISERGDLVASASKPLVQLTAKVNFDLAAPSDPLWLLLRDKKSSSILRQNLNDKGEARFDQGVLPGTYEVSFQSASQIFIKNLSASGARVTGRTLEIQGNGPVKLKMVAAQGEGEVSGVALRDGKDTAGAMVVLVPADPANNRVLFRRDQSDTDGTFALGNVVPGRYTLLAIQDGWELEWANPEVLSKFMKQGESLVVEPKGKYSVKVNVQ